MARIDFYGEVRVRELLKELKEITPSTAEQWPITAYWGPVKLVDTKKRTFSTEITGRAQGAICVYCNKQICAWGKINKPQKKKRSFRGYEEPAVLKDAIANHCIPCADDWVWRTLAAFSTNVMQATGQLVVQKWMKKIALAAERDCQLEEQLFRRFAPDVLPSPMGSEKANAMELVFMTIDSLRCERFAHGDEQHPHRFLKADLSRLEEQNVKTTTVADAENLMEWMVPAECLGMCPCGLVGPLDREAVNVTTYKLEY